jgi:[acyl-carrier-protein] S-malonyltransferase
MTFAFTFPGQGSQFPGMGKALADDFPSARAVFTEVDDALSQNLSALIWNGPESELTLTENAQPALMAVSLAVVRSLQAEYGNEPTVGAAMFAAGHSLGEYSALAAMGALSVAETARLLRIRGAAMQNAVPAGKGAMLALLGVDADVAEKVAAEAAGEGDVCQVANDNAPGQVVISGSAPAIERAMALSKDYGVRRAVPLTVSAPFHCALMRPAAERMADALGKVELAAPRKPVISNVTALPMTSPDEIRARLVEQVTGVVRWRDSVAFMAGEGVTMLFELGAGRVLTGLARRIDSRIDGQSIGTPAEIQSFAARLTNRAAA